jgi:hypothetical protein
MKMSNFPVYAKRHATNVDLEIDGLNVMKYLALLSQGLNLIVVSYISSSKLAIKFTTKSLHSSEALYDCLLVSVVSGRPNITFLGLI